MIDGGTRVVAECDEVSRAVIFREVGGFIESTANDEEFGGIIGSAVVVSEVRLAVTKKGLWRRYRECHDCHYSNGQRPRWRGGEVIYIAEEVNNK